MTTRVAAVTGGIGGLGTAICKALARDGCSVVAADLGGDPARIARFEREVDGLDIRFMALDVSDFDACGAFVREVQSRFGSLDVIVNNAGITRDSTLRKMTHAQWQALLDVNLGSAFNLCRHAIDGMLERGFGRIVNISSISGQTGNFGQTNYAAAKAGLHGFTMSLARETASKGITVNSVSPGYIETPMTAVNDYPMPFMLPADEAARRFARAIDAGTGYTVIPWQMGVVAKLLRLLPNLLFDRIFARAGRKPRGLLDT